MKQFDETYQIKKNEVMAIKCFYWNYQILFILSL